MRRLPAPVKPGDVITAALYNAIAEVLEDFHNLQVGPGLRMDRHPNGIALALAEPRGIVVRLSGAASPYSWEEVEPLAGGTWGTFHARTGTTDAYEINARAGLGGKVVRLTRTAANDWRFAWLGRGCNPANTFVCALVSSSCIGGGIVAGKTVTVSFSGMTVGTCTTSGTVTALTLISGGSGYTNGIFSLGFSGGGTGAAGTFTVSGGVVTTLNLTAGGTGYDSAAPTITFPGAGSGSGASAAATVKGRCCVGTTHAGNHTVSVAGDCDTPSGTASVSCGTTATVSLTATGATVVITLVPECGGTMGTYTYLLTGHGVSLTGTASSTSLSFCVPVFGSYTLSLTTPCFVDPAATVTVGSCSATATVNLTAKTYSLSGVVHGCGSAVLPGATVTISGDAGAGSTTTDGSGAYTIAGLKARCDFTLTVSKSRFNTFTQSSTLGCSDSTQNVFLDAASGYVCWCNCVDPLVDLGTGLMPVTITDGQGTHSVYANWNGTAVTRTDCIGKTNVTVSCIDVNGCCGVTYTANVGYYYRLSCNGDGTITLTRSMPSCPSSTCSGTTPHPVESLCQGTPPDVTTPTTTPAACSAAGQFAGLAGLQTAESVTQPNGSCPGASASFGFTFGFGDTATVNGS